MVNEEQIIEGASPLVPETEGVPLAPEEETSTPMTEEEMKADINGEVSKLKDKEQELNSKTEAGDTKTNDIRKQVMTSFFDLMKNAGVDLQDLESINAFLQDLQKRDPDIAELFEYVFSSLFGGGDAGQEQDPAGPGGLVGPTPSLPGDLTGQIPAGPAGPVGPGVPVSPGAPVGPAPAIPEEVGVPQSPVGPGAEPSGGEDFLNRYKNVNNNL